MRVNGAAHKFKIRRLGDVQFAEVAVERASAEVEVVFDLLRAGSDVAVRWEPAAPGAANEQIRVLRSVADETSLTLTLEGRTGSSHSLTLVTDREVVSVAGAELLAGELTISFAGEGDVEGWVRREVVVGVR